MQYKTKQISGEKYCVFTYWLSLHYGSVGSIAGFAERKVKVPTISRGWGAVLNDWLISE